MIKNLQQQIIKIYCKFYFYLWYLQQPILKFINQLIFNEVILFLYVTFINLDKKL
ncbi:hypothetical protein pb186bvf_003173 [Paramecium bursaria]